MLERLLYFKEEISIVLNKASILSNSKKKDINIEYFYTIINN